MKSINVTLIGFHDQGNLGLGYLGAVLEQHGFKVVLLDFRLGKDVILKSVRLNNPLLVGFSLIFQYYLDDFKSLAKFLRQSGVISHFCIGGHFPTLRYEQLLTAMPEIDTVVRCEGELTLLSLVQRLYAGDNWRNVEGIAYREDNQVIATSPRRLIENLDDLPFPLRENESLIVLGKIASPILAGRGCTRNCAFCSIRRFYLEAPGNKKRIRSAKDVVKEMKCLNEERRVSIFLFQDDDFPLHGKVGRRWIEQFLNILDSTDFTGKIIWKISCRADEVESNLFSKMRAAGLYMVYLGLESGTEAGLRTLNKQLTVEDNLKAIKILKNLELSIAYGFMLFDPSTCFSSLQENIAFLRKICRDGSLPAVACRMIPYAGTPIEETLQRDGRLRGDSSHPDYEFAEPRLNRYFELVDEFLTYFMQGTDSISNQIGWAWQEYWVINRLFKSVAGLSAYKQFLKKITTKSNALFLDLIQRTSLDYSDGQRIIPELAEIKKQCARFSAMLIEERNNFMVKNQERLLKSIDLYESV